MDEADSALPTPQAHRMAAALLCLAELDAGQGVALTRLAKHLGERVSVLLRLYTQLGPTWVRLHCSEGGRWLAHITPEGLQGLQGLRAVPVREDEHGAR